MPYPSSIIAQDEPYNGMFSQTTQIILVALAVISSLISLLFPLLFFVRRKCREHPSSLIAIISLLEALSNYNIILIAVNIYEFQHFVKIQEVFDFLVFYRTGEPSETDFCKVNFTIYIVLQLMSIAYNISFSADLLVTLQKPFFSGAKRMKFYHLLCLTLVVCALPMSIIEAEDICNKEFHSRSIYKIPLAFLASLVLFMIISIIIILLSFRTAQSSQIRRKYIHLHRIILITLIILWALPVATNILILLQDESSTLFQIFNLGSFISLLLSGAIINIVRFYNDPFVWTQIKKMVTECQWVEKKTKKDDDEDVENVQQDGDSWNLPLAHAVATFHHQSVVSNIIEIVLETCTNTPQQLAIHKSQFAHGSQLYRTQSAILSIKQIKKMLRQGTKQQTKRLVKIVKTQQMLCLAPKQDQSEPQKNIIKTINYQPQDSTKDNPQITIKVKSYADPIFVALRLQDNLTSQQLNKTLNLISNTENIKKARQSLGASGSFFFFSYDNRLVIKTINQKQCQIFLKILPEYYSHILNNGNSLISRAYGLFSVQIAGISKIYFIMMENTLRMFQENGIVYKKYDLKGSTIKRQVRNPKADVFKDINFLKSDNPFLIMPQHRKSQLLTQLKSDLSLLTSQNIMDYSLLLGIGTHKPLHKPHPQIMTQQDLHHQLSQQQDTNEWRCFDDGYQVTGKIYSISIIDYLQQFDYNKRMELMLKKMFKGGGDISSVDTESYYKRFMEFVGRIIVVWRR